MAQTNISNDTVRMLSLVICTGFVANFVGLLTVGLAYNLSSMLNSKQSSFASDPSCGDFMRDCDNGTIYTQDISVYVASRCQIMKGQFCAVEELQPLLSVTVACITTALAVIVCVLVRSCVDALKRDQGRRDALAQVLISTRTEGLDQDIAALRVALEPSYQNPSAP